MNVIEDRKGACQWVLMPRSFRAPDHVKVTRAQVFYPATGLLEERVDLETVVGADWAQLPRQ
jgi:hypothetical protein